MDARTGSPIPSGGRVSVLRAAGGTVQVLYRLPTETCPVERGVPCEETGPCVDL